MKENTNKAMHLSKVFNGMGYEAWQMYMDGFLPGFNMYVHDMGSMNKEDDNVIEYESTIYAYDRSMYRVRGVLYNKLEKYGIENIILRLVISNPSEEKMKKMLDDYSYTEDIEDEENYNELVHQTSYLINEILERYQFDDIQHYFPDMELLWYVKGTDGKCYHDGEEDDIR